MARYAIGDVQGCFVSLKCLLDRLSFDPQQDELWFAGDLVNRGPDSLECLRFIKGLGSSARVVLGNHDLHLLAIHARRDLPKRKDTLAQVLEAPDCLELMQWLKQQPLMVWDAEHDYVMVHDTGGYYFSNHFDYNSLPRVGVYAVSGADDALQIECIRQADSIEDVLSKM